TTDLARTFVLVAGIGRNAGRARRGDRGTGGRGRRGRAGCGGRGRCRFGIFAFLGLDFGLALGLFLEPVAFFLGLATGFGRFALLLFDEFAGRAPGGFRLGDFAFLVGADLGFGQGTGTGAALV